MEFYQMNTRLRFLTAGESHGPALVAILEGLPAGLSLNSDIIDDELARRQRGFGAGPRMKIETRTLRPSRLVITKKPTAMPNKTNNTKRQDGP